MKLKIFKDKGKTIDLPTFIDSRALICANSGGGKSYCIRKILEESHKEVMAIVLDVEGEFKTLREKYDFLLVGNSGDVPLNMGSAHLLPRKLLEMNCSTIIDISDLKMHERIQYAKKFLEALMELPRKNEEGEDLWKPCIIVLDEAHLLAGQQEKQDSTHAVIDLMTRGRKRGFCGILATQRISKLHKDAVAEANNYLVGRIGLDIDMKRASEILGFTSKEQMLSLRDLEAGEFYLFGTAISRSVDKAFIGEVQTTHPKVGMDVRKNIIPPTEEVKKILQKLADLPQEAKKDLKDKEDLKKEISILKTEIHKLENSKPKIDADSLEVAERKGFNRGVKESEIKYDSYIKPLERDVKTFVNSLRKVKKDIDSILESRSLSLVGDIPIKGPEFKSEIKRPARVLPTKPILPIPVRSIEPGGPLGKCERIIYSFLYSYPNKAFSRSQIGAVTGYSANSGSFNNALSKLNSLGLINKNGESIQVASLDASLTDTMDFSINNIINVLNKCEKEIYQIVSENPNTEYPKEELGSLCPSNYSGSSGSFNNALSRLNTLGLIKKSSTGIMLNPELLEI